MTYKPDNQTKSSLLREIGFHRFRSSALVSDILYEDMVFDLAIFFDPFGIEGEYKEKYFYNIFSYCKRSNNEVCIGLEQTLIKKHNNTRIWRFSALTIHKHNTSSENPDIYEKNIVEIIHKPKNKHVLAIERGFLYEGKISSIEESWYCRINRVGHRYVNIYPITDDCGKFYEITNVRKLKKDSKDYEDFLEDIKPTIAAIHLLTKGITKAVDEYQEKYKNNKKIHFEVSNTFKGEIINTDKSYVFSKNPKIQKPKNMPDKILKRGFRSIYREIKYIEWPISGVMDKYIKISFSHYTKILELIVY